MPWITAENAPAIQGVLNIAAADKPQTGDTARVLHGKHSGKVGVIRKHMLSRFKKPFRYGSELSHAMTVARGRYGYIVLLEAGGETFWADANSIMLGKEG